MRYFFEIAYNGTHYHGWQKQPNAISIQEVVENALSTLLQNTISITGSGRTDTGVHCMQQYFHTDIGEEINETDLCHRLNRFLPADISIKRIQKVKPDAHARFDAIERRYQYRITRFKNPFLSDFSYLFLKSLDIGQMNLAALELFKHIDFQCFSKVKTETATYNCTITEAKWILQNDELYFYVSANRFLRGMVRAIAGTLLDVGQRKLSTKDFEEIIISKDRTKAGSAIPAKGLFLTHVRYPDSIFL